MTLTTEIFKKIDLSNSPNFSGNVVLDKQSCTLSFLWNNKIKRYCATLVKTNGDTVFEGVVVNPISNFPVASIMLVKGFYGMFTLWPYDLSMVDTEETLKNWADYYFLIYTMALQ